MYLNIHYVLDIYNMIIKKCVFTIFVIWIFNICGLFGYPQYQDWNGLWFPHPPNSPDINPVVVLDKKNLSHLHDDKHGIVMGVKDSQCDDAETNLHLDWYNNAENYTCFEDRHMYLPNYGVHPKLSSEHIPTGYNAAHACMDESLDYNSRIPTFGTHRPLWAKYGEYKFVPRQRWIHNLEHGAIVMLYHPCANRMEVNLLRSLVTSCLYRHIITPYNLMTSTRPLALVSWGHRLEMSKVAPELVIDFIKKHALKGPEQTSRDGQYDYVLTRQAEILPQSDVNDVNLCPKHQMSQM